MNKETIFAVTLPRAVVLLLAWCLSGCNDRGTLLDQPAASEPTEQATVPAIESKSAKPVNGLGSHQLVVMSGESVVGAFLGGTFSGQGGVFLMPDGKVLSFDMWSGQYVTEGTLFFSNNDCTGDVILGSNVNLKIPNRYIKAPNGKFYHLVGIATGFTYNSYYTSSGCTISASAVSGLPALEEVPASTMPSDLADLAPLNLTVSQ